MGSELKRWVAFSILVMAVTVTLRAPILHRSIIDWDESVYLLVSSTLLDGALPYIELWSHKQPFLFVLFATSFIAPDPIVGMRLLGCVGIAVTAVLLGFMAKRVVGRWTGAILAALLYVLATMGPGGLATNTEILYSPFVAAAFVILVFLRIGTPAEGTKALSRFVIAGLLSGLAMQIKLVAAFDVLVLSVSSILFWWPKETRLSAALRQATRRSLCFGLGLILPFTIAVSVYWWNGVLDEYLFANFGFNLAYTDLDVDRSGLFLAAMSRQASQGNLMVLALGVLGIPWSLWWARKMKPEAFSPILVAAFWYLAAVVSVFASAKFYNHHLLQIVPAAVLLSTISTVTILRGKKFSLKVVAVALMVCLVAVQAIHAKRHLALTTRAPDTPRAVGQFLRDRKAPGDSIFVANSQPIIYLIAGVHPPSRYVQPIWIIRPEIRSRLGLDLENYLEGIFDQRPSFVVMERDHPWLPDGAFVDLLVVNYLDGRYQPVAEINSVIVFRALDTVE